MNLAKDILEKMGIKTFTVLWAATVAILFSLGASLAGLIVAFGPGLGLLVMAFFMAVHERRSGKKY